MPYELDHIHQICLDEAFNTFLSERFPPSTKRNTRGMIYAEFRLWSIKHAIMWTVWRVILAQAMLQQNLSCMVLENERIQQLNLAAG